MNQVLKFYKESSKNRTSSKTVRNERSSRSHAIFRLEMNGHVENIEGIKDTCSGKVNFWFYRYSYSNNVHIPVQVFIINEILKKKHKFFWKLTVESVK